MEDEVLELLRKKAFGYHEVTDRDTESGRGKEKYYPPDLDALKLWTDARRAMVDVRRYEFMSNSELRQELTELLKSLEGDSYE